MKQIAIVTKNRQGLAADIAEVLANQQINIETLDGEEVQELAVITLTVDKYNEALQALRDAGYHAVTEDAILLRVRDEPGALAKVARRFKDAGIPLRSVRIIQREAGYGVMAISTERTQAAMELVKDLIIAG